MSIPAARGRYLAVDTATEACSVALWMEGRVLEKFAVAQREHTQKLLPMIREVLAEGGTSVARLDGIACGVGPGSFAGVRIGVGVVKGLALARDLPVVGVSSLLMLAQRRLRDPGVVQVAAAIDARMNEVYFGTYRQGSDQRAVVLMPECVCVPSQAPGLPAGMWKGVGSGWAVHEQSLRRALAVDFVEIDRAALPHAESALEWAVPEFLAGRVLSVDELSPVYLRNQVALTLEDQADLRARKGRF